MIKLTDDDSRPRKRKTNGNNLNRNKWIIFVTIISFFLSAFFLFISNIILDDVSVAVAILVLVLIILIGVVTDIIGISVARAREAPFHAMASRKLYGAKRAIRLIKNADRVSSFCNDVIGDICGIVSGTAGTLILLKMAAGQSSGMTLLINLGLTGLLASATIGGKAVGKKYALEKSNEIVYRVGVILQFISLKGKRGGNGTGKAAGRNK